MIKIFLDYVDNILLNCLASTYQSMAKQQLHGGKLFNESFPSGYKIDISCCSYTSPPIVEGNLMLLWSNPYVNVESDKIRNLNYWELRRRIITEWDSSWSKEELYKFVTDTIQSGSVGPLINFKVFV